MADILDVDPDAIGPSTGRDNTHAWDSLKHLMLCLALEQEFGISLDVDDIESMVSYAAVMRVLHKALHATGTGSAANQPLVTSAQPRRPDSASRRSAGRPPRLAT